MKEEYDSDKVHYIYHYCISVRMASTATYRDGILRLHDPIETEDDYRDLRYLLFAKHELPDIEIFSVVSLSLISNGEPGN